MATIDELKILVTAEVGKALGDLDKVEGSAKNVKGAFESMRDIMQGPVALAKSMGGALREVFKAAEDLYNKYAEQERAALVFGQAIKNAGMDENAQRRLTDFANELQKVTIYEDDATIAIMANLVSMGKTEAEIKKIVQVAADFASATGTTMEDAVVKLNMTLQGNIGRLGQQYGALKKLTQEELAAGKAIDILGDATKGQAEIIGKSASGTAARLKNVKEEAQEVAGTFVAIAAQPALEKIIDATTKMADSQRDAADTLLAVRGKITDPQRIQELIEYNEVIANEQGWDDAATGIHYSNEEYQKQADLLKDILKKMTDIKKAAPSVQSGMRSTIQGLNGGRGNTGKGFQVGANMGTNIAWLGDASDGFADIVLNAQQAESAANAMTGAFADFGAALVEGENPAKAFFKSLISSVGDAVLAYAALVEAEGWAMVPPNFIKIAKGIGLATVGGAVKASAYAMAEGGSGTVSKPTLFLAGESGPEDFAFGPKRKGGLGVTQNFYIAGSVIREGEVGALGLSQMAGAMRGY